jgi:hypothetical protein
MTRAAGSSATHSHSSNYFASTSKSVLVILEIMHRRRQLNAAGAPFLDASMS